MGELVSISTGSLPGSLCSCTAESLPPSAPCAPHGLIVLLLTFLVFLLTFLVLLLTFLAPHVPHIPRAPPHVPHIPHAPPHVPHIPRAPPHVPHVPRAPPHVSCAPHVPCSPPRTPPHGPHTPLLATRAPPEFHWKKPLQILRHKSFVGCHTHHPFVFSLQFATLTRSSSRSSRSFSLHRPQSRLWSLISVSVFPRPSSCLNHSKLHPRILL